MKILFQRGECVAVDDDDDNDDNDDDYSNNNDDNHATETLLKQTSNFQMENICLGKKYLLCKKTFWKTSDASAR